MTETKNNRMPKKPAARSNTEQPKQSLGQADHMESYNALEVKERLKQEWPHLFGEQCRPLPIGVDRLIYKALAGKPGALSRVHIEVFLKEYCCSKAYLQALIDDRRRYGLRPGSKVGYVSKGQKERAAASLQQQLQPQVP